MNNKSRIALAIAAALGVSSGAMAQTSTVQLGGSLNFFYQKASSTGGPTGSTNGTKSHDNLSLSEPELWIHGEEKIGANTVWFRCTSSFDLMGTSASATTSNGVSTAPSAGQFCGRNSALGFKGNFGNIFAGTWDTPQKLVLGEVRGWWGGTASLTGGFANMLLGGAGSNTGNSGATMYERRARSISYHSPDFSGFKFKGMFSAANESTIASAAATQSLTPRLFGLSADYTNGPLYIGAGFEQHKDYNPSARTTITNRNVQGVNATISVTTTMTPAIGNGVGEYSGGTDSNYVIGARYTFGFGTRLSGLYTKTKYETSNGADATKAGWAIFVDHQLSGPHSIKGQYYKVGDTKGSAVLGSVSAGAGATAVPVTLGQHQSPGAATGAHGWSLAYMYQLSKRTEMGFVYGVIDNETNATYSKGVNTAAPGSTQRGYGLNVRHKF